MTSTPHLIGLHGPEASGKDTVAQMLTPMGYEQFAFADNVREGLIRLDPLVTSETSLCQLVETFGWDEAKRHRIYGPEVRRLMRVFDHEVAQGMFGQLVWVELLERAVEESGVFGRGRLIAISDVRYAHESRMIHRHGGQVWRIDRPGVSHASGHASDQPLAASFIDNVINNDSDMKSLSVAVANALSDSPMNPR